MKNSPKPLPCWHIWAIRRTWLRRAVLITAILPETVWWLGYVYAWILWRIAAVVALVVIGAPIALVQDTISVLRGVPAAFRRTWRGEMPWQPVETAPAGVWLWTQREGEDTGCYSIVRRWPGEEPEWFDLDGYSSLINPGSFAAPTHWQHLDDAGKKFIADYLANRRRSLVTDEELR